LKRKSKSNIYIDDGTIYFFSGKSYKDSGVVIIIYDKMKEIRDKNKSSKKNDILQYTTNQEVVRFEIKCDRDKIKYELEKYNNVIKKNFINILGKKDVDIKKFNLKDCLYETKIKDFYQEVIYDIRERIFKCNINNDVESRLFKESTVLINSCLDDLICIEFQKHMLSLIIKAGNLDKVITTRSNLFRIIRTNFSSTKSKTLIKIIKYENGEINKINLAKGYLGSCKNEILELGYSYYYADEEIKPINIKDLIKDVTPNEKYRSI
jgi:hypothetical protein